MNSAKHDRDLRISLTHVTGPVTPEQVVEAVESLERMRAGHWTWIMALFTFVGRLARSPKVEWWARADSVQGRQGPFATQAEAVKSVSWPTTGEPFTGAFVWPVELQ